MSWEAVEAAVKNRDLRARSVALEVDIFEEAGRLPDLPERLRAALVAYRAADQAYDDAAAAAALLEVET